MSPKRSPISITLWIVQGVLALIFLFAGCMKLAMPADVLSQQAKMPVLFLQLIAVAEIAGALGLLLPGIFRIRPGLTPLAAVCLMVIMIGATIMSASMFSVAQAVFPFVTLLLLGFVAYGRWRIAPLV